MSVLWRRLQVWVTDLRRELGQDAAFEWFQWLAERLDHFNADGAEPAYEMYADWVPAHLRPDL